MIELKIKFKVHMLDTNLYIKDNYAK
jgi:hypothetical protein